MTHISAEELFSLLAQAQTQANPPEGLTDEAAAELSVKSIVNEVLALACQFGLRASQHAFGNLSSQIDTLCKRHNINLHLTIAIQRARHITLQHAQSDIWAVANFIATVFSAHIPPFIHRPPLSADDDRNAQAHVAPGSAAPSAAPHAEERINLRCIVQKTGPLIEAITIGTPAPSLIHIDIIHTPDYIDLSYLHDIIHEGTMLSLLRCESPQPGVVIPHLVVVEPDFLVDISILAACFEDYGHHPLLYQFKRLSPRANSQPILMGDLAGQLLDNAIHQPEASLASALRTCFQQHALEFAACRDFNPAAFKMEALTQQKNINDAVADLFDGNSIGSALLEPSFFSEQLGIQGRADLLTADFKLLVEQKAGRNFFVESNAPGPYGRHIEKHYVQMLLYYAILAFNFNVASRHIDMLLLYSKYPLPNGLIEVAPLQKLMLEAIKLRNLIVDSEYTAANKGFEQILPLLTPDTVNTNHAAGTFWNRYQLPALQAIATPLQSMSPLENAYFCRMATFVLKEQLLAKVGSPNSANNRSAADLWNLSPNEKVEQGTILAGLRIVNPHDSQASRDADGSAPQGDESTDILLDIPEYGDDFQPNFRRGDMVYLYAYDIGQEPNPRQALLHRATIASISSSRLLLHLLNPQPTLAAHHASDTATTLFAVEHAASDVGTSSAMAGLHQLIAASSERRALLLATREPQYDTTLTLTRHYHPHYDDVLLRAKQARDFFLLIGPPGTGKTSMALRFLVEEELTAPGASVLLMAYTNRAVDEISAMLQQAAIPFLRIGNEHSCPTSLRPHLLSTSAAEQPTLAAIKQQLATVPVIVSTTATLLARPFIFAIRAFSLAIVDEASQILEPAIMGILARPQIGRFILVGDHKQLPAVVLQSATESAVDHPLLRAIHLTNCRDSLFERLLRTLSTTSPLVGVLRRQGRMHPDIALWPNTMFYRREQLQAVPLPHQQEPTTSPRVVFIPQPAAPQAPSSSAASSAPRRIAALLKQVYDESAHFSAEKTVGVIVVYRNQIAKIRQEIERLHIPLLQQVSIDTVERYQGSQRDVIVYAVDIDHRYQLDFLTCNSFEEDGCVIDRKLNVALTRARKQLYIVGNERILRESPLYSSLIDFIKQKGGYKGEFYGE